MTDSNVKIANGARIVNVKDYGAKGDGTTNDTLAIENAIKALSANGTIFFPEGTYLVSKVIASFNNVEFLGASKYGTIIKSISQNKLIKDKGLISLKDRTVKNITFNNFTIDANRFGQAIIANGNGGNNQSTYTHPFSGIYIPNSVGEFDNYHTIKDIYVHHAPGCGVKVEPGSQEIRILNVRCQDNNEDGYYLGSSDGFLENCTSYSNRGHGYYFVNSGMGNRIVNSKSYGNHKCGFYVYAKKTLLSNCSSEENREDGFFFNECQYTVGSNLTSDQNSVTENGKPKEKKFCGYKFLGAKNVSVTNSIVSERHNLQGDGHKYSVLIDKGCTHLNIDLIDAYDMHVNKLSEKWRIHPEAIIQDYSRQISNVVRINGSLHSMTNLQDKKIGKEQENNRISEAFDKMVSYSKCTGNALVSYHVPSCQLILASAEQATSFSTPGTGTLNAGVGVSRTVKVLANQALSISIPIEFDGKSSQTARESAFARCGIIFRDSNGKIISHKTCPDIEYYNDTFNLTANAPANTSQAEIMVLLIPKSKSTPKTYIFIRDFKYGIAPLI